MTGDAPHVARGGVVDDAAQDFTVYVFGGRDTRAQRLRRPEHTLVHAQRHEHFGTNKVRLGCLGQPPHDFAKQDEIDVAVKEARSGRRYWFRRQSHADAGFISTPGRFQVQMGGIPKNE